MESVLTNNINNDDEVVDDDINSIAVSGVGGFTANFNGEVVLPIHSRTGSFHNNSENGYLDHRKSNSFYNRFSKSLDNVNNNRREELFIDNLNEDISSATNVNDDELHNENLNPISRHNTFKSTASSNEAYSIFSRHHRLFIVIIVAIAGFFSPLTGNIYFPAIEVIADEFNESITMINLTITIYMVIQGIAPSIWCPIADFYGRRFIYISCFIIYACANLGIALCTSYWQLFALRIVQAAGSSSMIALGAGVIGDIADAEERGTFIGFFTIGPMAGPAIGPILGGILEYERGWRSIFWFLFGLSIGGLLFVVSFLPETLRKRVGNGSIKVEPYMRSIQQILKPSGKTIYEPIKRDPNDKFSLMTFISTLRLTLYPDFFSVLIYNSLYYAVYMTSTASLTTFLTANYGLNTIQIGLCFLPIGVGSIAGTIFSGYILDYDYSRYREKYCKGMSAYELRARKMYKFPLEHARLIRIPIYSALMVISILCFGWTLEKRVSLAAPLIFHFIIGFTATALMGIAQTILVDLSPTKAAGATACNNLFRCIMGAWAIGINDYVFNYFGAGFGFMIYLSLCVVATPFYIYEWFRGQQVRENRLRKLFPELIESIDEHDRRKNMMNQSKKQDIENKNNEELKDDKNDKSTEEEVLDKPEDKTLSDNIQENESKISINSSST